GAGRFWRYRRLRYPLGQHAADRGRRHCLGATLMNLFKIHIYSMRCDRSWFLDKFQLFKTKNSLVFHNFQNFLLYIFLIIN
ncbi:MAG: hypothetical protein ACKPEO_07505, partial [Sphaerospermopsis kisseleviana]